MISLLRPGVLIATGIVTAFGCEKGDKSTYVDTPVHPLVGVWTTERPDPEGETRFTLTLEEDGALFMVEILSSGGQRSFPGTWEVDGEELTLKAVYFEPDGESTVRYSIDGDVLMLLDSNGSEAVWSRLT